MGDKAINIFVTSYDPAEAAQHLDDKRLVKMVLETAQLLSGAMPIGPYRLTHYSHPCSKWARESSGNYRWLLAHFVALLNEYTRRYDKDHKCGEHLATFAAYAANLEDGSVTPFANVTNFKEETDVRKSYQLHLAAKWDRQISEGRGPTWRTRDIPGWYLRVGEADAD